MAGLAVNAIVLAPEGGFTIRAAGWLTQVGLQLFTAVLNLLPVGPLDGAKIVSAWQSLRI